MSSVCRLPNFQAGKSGEYSVLYGSDLDCRIVGSGFPQHKDLKPDGRFFAPTTTTKAAANAHADASADANADANVATLPTSKSKATDPLSLPNDDDAVRQYQRDVWRLYAEDGWNLNNIPLLSQSVLQVCGLCVSVLFLVVVLLIVSVVTLKVSG